MGFRIYDYLPRFLAPQEMASWEKEETRMMFSTCKSVELVLLQGNKKIQTKESR
jgi:hypothetical protein